MVGDLDVVLGVFDNERGVSENPHVGVVKVTLHYETGCGIDTYSIKGDG